MPDPTLWISEADVVSVLDLAEAIAVLAAGFAAESAGRVVPLEKTMASFAGGGTLHALGAASEELAGPAGLAGLAGAKTWAHTPGGADPLLLLFDAANGGLVAAIEAFALGQLRTSATAGLATDRLARPDARHLGIIGTGKQALAQVAAVAAVRPISQVRAFSRNPDRREAFAARVREQLGLSCAAVSSAAEAADGADVITLVTRATEPVLTAAMVRPGMHINAVGAIDLARREFQPAILRRATVVTDSFSQARNLSAELRECFGPPDKARDEAWDEAWDEARDEALEGWRRLRALGDVVREAAGRSDPDEVTVFKGMGSGVADLAIGAEVLARVRAAGGGIPVVRGGRAALALVKEKTP
jgi:ornithine cyclodeaminase